MLDVKKVFQSIADFKKVPIFASQFRGIATKQNGSVVQLVRIHACHAWGRGFESRPDRLKKQIFEVQKIERFSELFFVTKKRIKYQNVRMNIFKK